MGGAGGGGIGTDTGGAATGGAAAGDTGSDSPAESMLLVELSLRSGNLFRPGRG
jgi:hypothetical protein